MREEYTFEDILRDPWCVLLWPYYIVWNCICDRERETLAAILALADD
jgi:hypothetical protein